MILIHGLGDMKYLLTNAEFKNLPSRLDSEKLQRTCLLMNLLRD